VGGSADVYRIISAGRMDGVRSNEIRLNAGKRFVRLGAE